MDEDLRVAAGFCCTAKLPAAESTPSQKEYKREKERQAREKEEKRGKRKRREGREKKKGKRKTSKGEEKGPETQTRQP